MSEYRLAVGTHDPHAFAADTDGDAIGQAVGLVMTRYGAELQSNPQEVATLLGPGGALVSRPGERIDEFVTRATGSNPAGDRGTVQPGDSNTPDCNGD